MNSDTIRRIDRYLGRGACFLFTLHRRLCDSLKGRGACGGGYNKVLFIKLIEQGSTVLAYPALKKAAAEAGEENVYFLVFKEGRPILDILGVVKPSNVIEVDPSGIGRLFTSVIKALLTIRKEKIDAVIDMEFFARGSAILAYLSGAKKRAGLHPFTCEGLYRGDLLTHRLLYNPYLHTRVYFAGLVEALSHASAPDNTPLIFETPVVTDDAPRFSPSDDEKNAIIKKVELLKQAPLSRPVIVLNPNSGDLLPVRKWPEDNFIKLGSALLKEFPQATIIVTGTPDEKARAGMVSSGIGPAVSLAGQTTLRELLTLFSVSDCLVTNDSGPAHFSALTSIKSMILFGPETPALYGTTSGKSDNMAAPLICSPCVSVYNHRNSPCKRAICMQAIKVADVLKKITTLLK
ncbi:glycosyltransferase family 9 protein [Candidatus Omnitrophota bacterium]